MAIERLPSLRTAQPILKPFSFRTNGSGGDSDKDNPATDAREQKRQEQSGPVVTNSPEICTTRTHHSGDFKGDTYESCKPNPNYVPGDPPSPQVRVPQQKEPRDRPGDH